MAKKIGWIGSIVVGSGVAYKERQDYLERQVLWYILLALIIENRNLLKNLLLYDTNIIY